MMAGFGHPNNHLQPPGFSAEPSVQHDYACGQARWGMSRDGRVLGAFLYQPASFLDSGVGIALFEMELDDKGRFDGLWSTI